MQETPPHVEPAYDGMVLEFDLEAQDMRENKDLTGKSESSP
jgi:hypothetical protein